MSILLLDLETFFDKEYSLRRMTPAEYVQDSRFEAILMCAQLDDGPIEVIDGPDIPRYLAGLDASATTTVAFNALFDNLILAYRYGFVPALILDTMGMARTLRGHVLKRFSLEVVARDLELGIKGDYVSSMVGVHRADIRDDPVRWNAYAEYCKQDVLLNRRIFTLLKPEFPASECRIMDLVLRGAIQPQFRANIDMLKAHIDDVRAKKAELLAACGVDVGSLMSANKFAAALEALGVTVETKVSPTGKTVPQFARTDPFMGELQEHPDIRVQTLAAARLGHKSTIEETRAQKIIGVAECMPDRLLPVPLRYSGAHTFRLSGDWGLNLQNLPTARGSKGLSRLRESLVPPPGHSAVSCDLGQIEARLVAWLCSCVKLLTQFRDKLDPYALLAAEIFGRPINRKVDIVEGFIGKTGILGLGYGCGATKFHKMVTTMARMMELDVSGIFNEKVAQAAVDTYRSTYSEIPRAWYALNNAIDRYLLVDKKQAVKFKAVTIGYGVVKLPNELCLRYGNPRREDGEVKFDYGGISQKIYGGKLLENITQALARLVVMEAALRIARRGYRFALQAHDELVFVVPDAELDDAKGIIHSEMIRPPTWALDLPLTADIGSGKSYGETK